MKSLIPKIGICLFWLFTVIGMLAFAVVLGGCSSSPSINANGASGQQAADLGGNVQAQASSISSNAMGIKSDVHAADVATPADAKPQIQPHLIAADAKADAIIVSTQQLSGISGQLADLKNKIAADETAHAKEVAGLEKQLADAKSDLTRRINWLILSAIAIAGVCVFLGFLLHDFTYSVAGIAGCGTVIGIALFVGTLASLMKWIVLGVIAAAATWIGITWYRKGGSLWAALKVDWQTPVVQQAISAVQKVIPTTATDAKAVQQ